MLLVRYEDELERRRILQEYKYKVGDRFVIEISSLPMSSDGTYYFTSAKTFYSEGVLDNLPQFPNEEDENDLYMLTQEEKSIIEERNLSYVWNLVNEIINTDWTFADARDCFGIDINGKTGFQITREMFSGNPKEIKERFEKWKKEKEEINVGDVVTVDGGDLTFICTKNNESGDYTKCHLLASDGSVWEEREKSGLKKTGKSIDISGILKEI